MFGMRRVFLVAPLAVALLIPAAGAQTLQARVWLADSAPLLVRGSGFHARQYVTVTVSLDKTALRKVVLATDRGAFAARFRASASDCGLLAISARDMSGRLATWKRPPASCGTRTRPTLASNVRAKLMETARVEPAQDLNRWRRLPGRLLALHELDSPGRSPTVTHAACSGAAPGLRPPDRVR